MSITQSRSRIPLSASNHDHVKYLDRRLMVVVDIDGGQSQENNELVKAFLSFP